MSTTTYVVRTNNPDGFDTRNSGTMVYTHAVVADATNQEKHPGQYAISWHTTAALAAKAAASWREHGHGEAHVEPVEAHEGGKAKVERALRAAAADNGDTVVEVDGVKVAETKRVTLTGEAKKAYDERVANQGGKKATAAKGKGSAKTKAAKALVNEPTATKATKAKAAKVLADQRAAALEKAREVRAANMSKPAPLVDGITWGLSGKHHGLVEGSKFSYHGKDKAAPSKKGQRLTMKIVDRVWITGVDSKGTEQMRVHIAGSFWAK